MNKVAMMPPATLPISANGLFSWDISSIISTSISLRLWSDYMIEDLYSVARGLNNDPVVISEETIDCECILSAAKILVTIVFTIKPKIISQTKYTTN